VTAQKPTPHCMHHHHRSGWRARERGISPFVHSSSPPYPPPLLRAPFATKTHEASQRGNLSLSVTLRAQYGIRRTKETKKKFEFKFKRAMKLIHCVSSTIKGRFAPRDVVKKTPVSSPRPVFVFFEWCGGSGKHSSRRHSINGRGRSGEREMGEVLENGSPARVLTHHQPKA